MRDVHCVTSPPRLGRRPSAMGRHRLELRPRIWVVQCHGSMTAEIYRVTLVILDILSADQQGRLDSTCPAFNFCAARSSMSCDAHQILELGWLREVTRLRRILQC